jgi:hypothetical protein
MLYAVLLQSIPLRYAQRQTDPAAGGVGVRLQAELSGVGGVDDHVRQRPPRITHTLGRAAITIVRTASARGRTASNKRSFGQAGGVLLAVSYCRFVLQAELHSKVAGVASSEVLAHRRSDWQLYMFSTN